jgi:DNA-binding cell septation regulator SpoVG
LYQRTGSRPTQGPAGVSAGWSVFARAGLSATRYENYSDFLRGIIHSPAGAGIGRMSTPELLRAAESENVLMPVYRKDGDEIGISAMPVWTYDSIYALENRQIGWIYAPHGRILEEFTAGSLTPELIENAKILLFGEVDYYNSYLRGECYRFDLYQAGKPVANYTGLLGNLEDVKKEIEDLVPDGCRGITDKLRYYEPGSETPPPEAGKHILTPAEFASLDRLLPGTAPPPVPDGGAGRLPVDENRGLPIEVGVFPISGPSGATVAIANIVVNNAIAINGISIERHAGDITVSMPKATDINGRTFNVCAVVAKDLRMQINDKIIGAYRAKAQGEQAG